MPTFKSFEDGFDYLGFFAESEVRMHVMKLISNKSEEWINDQLASFCHSCGKFLLTYVFYDYLFYFNTCIFCRLPISPIRAAVINPRLTPCIFRINTTSRRASTRISSFQFRP